HLLDCVTVVFGDDLAVEPHASLLGNNFEPVYPHRWVAEHGRFDATGECQVRQPLAIDRGRLELSTLDDRCHDRDRVRHAEPTSVDDEIPVLRLHPVDVEQIANIA